MKEKDDGSCSIYDTALEKSYRANVRVSVAIRYVPIAELGQSKELLYTQLQFCNMPSMMRDLDFMTDTEIALCLTKEERKAIGVKVLSSKLGTGGFKLSSGPKRYCDACRLPLLTKPGDLQEEFCAICEEIKKTLIEKMLTVDTTTSQATSAMFSPIAENSAVAKGNNDKVIVVDDIVTDEERINVAQDNSHTTMKEDKGSTDVTHHDNSQIINEYKGSDNASHDNSQITTVTEHKEGEGVVENGEILPNEGENQADIAGNVVFDATTAISPNENEKMETRFVNNAPAVQIDASSPDEDSCDNMMDNCVREDISRKKTIVATNSFSAMCAVTLSSFICHHESVCNGGNDVVDHPQEIMETKVIHKDTNFSDKDTTIIEDASEDAEDADEFDAQLNNLVGHDQPPTEEEASSTNYVPPESPSSRNYQLFLSSMAREKEEMKILLGCTPSNQIYIARPLHHMRFNSI